MSRLAPMQTNGATWELKRSLKHSRVKLKEVPNFFHLLANSPASLRAYIRADAVRADAALVRGQLTPRQRQQVALTVAEINGSSYSLSAHYEAGKSVGLTHHEMQLARNATAADPKAETMLRFTQAVVLQRGEISDDDFQALRKAGFADAQIVEIVANIALNIFSNYFNSVAKTKVDFPLLQPGTDVPRAGIAQSQTRPAALRARSTKPHIKFKPQPRMKIERMKMQTTLSQNKKFTGSPTQFAFQAPTTRRVSLAGDFNNWDTNAAPMQKGPDGMWRLSVPLGPGRYEYRFYADGVWRDDPSAQQRAVNALGTENCVRIIAKDSGMIATVKNAIVGAIKGTGDVVQATVNTITQTLGTTIKDTGKVGTSVTDAIADVARGAVRGTVQVGADLGQAAKGIMVGVLRGTKQAGTEVMGTISHTANVAIRDTAVVGGDLEAAATGLVQGAIAGAKELGVSAEDAAAAAASGALKGAGEVSSTALKTVRKAFTKTIHGVKVVAKEPEAVLLSNN